MTTRQADHDFVARSLLGSIVYVRLDNFHGLWRAIIERFGFTPWCVYFQTAKLADLCISDPMLGPCDKPVPKGTFRHLDDTRLEGKRAEDWDSATPQHRATMISQGDTECPIEFHPIVSVDEFRDKLIDCDLFFCDRCGNALGESYPFRTMWHCNTCLKIATNTMCDLCDDCYQRQSKRGQQLLQLLRPHLLNLDELAMLIVGDYVLSHNVVTHQLLYGTDNKIIERYKQIDFSKL